MSPSTTDLLPAARRWAQTLVRAVAALAIAGLTLTGCGSTTAPPQAPQLRTNELADAGGEPCPLEATVEGAGREEAPDEEPYFLEPHEAWVCKYELGESGWALAGQPQPVDEATLSRLHEALQDLEPAAPDRACTEELGPQWLVVSSHDGDLTGVLINDFGCRDVRLTDDPHTTPAGAPHQEGTVGGVFAGGSEILDALDVDRSR